MRIKLSIAIGPWALVWQERPAGRTMRFKRSSISASRLSWKAKSPTMEWINPHAWIHIDVERIRTAR